MKKLTIAALALLISAPTLSQDQAAEVSQWDVSFWSFKNFCTGEYVRPFPGETIQLVIRQAPSAGVSSRDSNIQVVIKDGVSEVVHLDTDVLGNCTAV